MGQYTSYYLYQKYETRGSQEAIPVYPNVYSIDADGTREMVIKLENDPECGYDPPIKPMYKWVNIPITQDYICDDCPEYQTRWIRTDETTCIKEGPDPQYRWVNMDASVDYYCEGTTKYYKQKRQVSFDGQTWQDVSPAEYQKGGVAETESTDCGYVPPIPTNKKFVYTAFERIYETECNGDGTLTKAEVFKDDSTSRYMTSAIIGDCVTVIEDEALSPNSPSYITSVTIGNNVTTIGRRAFFGCSGLTNVVLPDSVTTIRRFAFASCKSLTSINIPRGVTFIGDRAFWGCSGLTSSIDIPNGVTELYGGTFSNCYNLTSVHLPSGLTAIGGQEFDGCSLTSITIPNSVVEIGYAAFEGNNFTSLVIPNGATKIGQYAFRYCTNLTSCTIGSGVTYIGSEAFGSCSGLTSLTINAITPPTLRTDVFWNTNNCPIYVPSQSVEAYKSAEKWNTYSSRIQAIP